MIDEYESIRDGEIYYENSVGTKFWQVPDFDMLIEKCGLQAQVLISENIVDNEAHWCYCIVMDNGNVIHKSRDRNEIEEILIKTLNTLKEREK